MKLYTILLPTYNNLLKKIRFAASQQQLQQSKEAGIRTLVALDDQGGESLLHTNLLSFILLLTGQKEISC